MVLMRAINTIEEVLDMTNYEGVEKETTEQEPIVSEAQPNAVYVCRNPHSVLDLNKHLQL